MVLYCLMQISGRGMEDQHNILHNWEQHTSPIMERGIIYPFLSIHHMKMEDLTHSANSAFSFGEAFHSPHKEVIFISSIEGFSLYHHRRPNLQPQKEGGGGS